MMLQLNLLAPEFYI